jgi:SMC interacting uncharacterized protein involved in chromosome segregation
MNIKRWLGIEGGAAPEAVAGETERLRANIRDLEERLQASEARLRERTEALYVMQQHYSTEHFELAESMRNLKIERMRNAGAYAAQDVVLERYRRLQARIEELKQRLRQYETVEDLHEDTAPIVIDG